MNPPANSLWIGKKIAYRLLGCPLVVEGRITHLCGNSVLVSNGDEVPTKCIINNQGQPNAARSA